MDLEALYSLSDNDERPSLFIPDHLSIAHVELHTGHGGYFVRSCIRGADLWVYEGRFRGLAGDTRGDGGVVSLVESCCNPKRLKHNQRSLTPLEGALPPSVNYLVRASSKFTNSTAYSRITDPTYSFSIEHTTHHIPIMTGDYETFEGIYLDLSAKSGKLRFAPSGLGWKPAGAEPYTIANQEFVSAQWSRASKGYEVKLYTKTQGILQLDGFEQDVHHSFGGAARELLN